MNSFTKTIARIEITKRVISKRYPNMSTEQIAEKVRAMVPTPSFEDVEIVNPDTIQFSRF